MKKIISLVLTAIMLFSLAMPATAASNFNAVSSKSQIPVIRILGDAEPIYDAEGNKVFHLRTAFTGGGSDESEDDGDNEILESVANILLPFLIDGLLTDNWEPYYKNLQKEIGELTGNAKLDVNGEPVDGTGLSAERQAFLENARHNDQKGKKGYYGLYDYHFWYDWRLDPLHNADLLNDYITDIKNSTGCDKVGINASCLGTIVTTAYVAKYGVKDIQGIGFTGSLANGSEFLSEAISGKIDVNSAAVNRMLIDTTALGEIKLDEFINLSLELVLASGLVEFIESDIRENLYDKVAKGVTSALALSTIFTYPSYWATVSNEDYEDALLYVFGENYADESHEYAGLIKKIDNYHQTVRLHFTDIIKSIKAGGANFGAIAKYGFQIAPICQSYASVADQFVSVKRASFGATTSTIYDTLSAEHIDAKVAANLGQYISPDKQIDASTCIYPDYVWFVKNSSHSEYTEYEKKILYDVATADRQLTPADFEWSQFMVYDYETDTMAKMTTENCNTEKWEAKEDRDEGKDTPAFWFNFLTIFLKWLTQLFSKLSK